MNIKQKVQWSLYAGTGLLFGGLFSAISVTAEPTPYDLTSSQAFYGTSSGPSSLNLISTPALRRTYDHDDHYEDDDRYEHYGYDDDHDDHKKTSNRTSTMNASGYTGSSSLTAPSQQPTLQAPSQTPSQTMQTTRKVRTRLS